MQNNRSVQISAEDAGFSDLIEKLKKQGEEMYRSFNEEAKKQSDNLENQHRIINRLIDRQKDKLAMLREEQRIQEQMRLASRLDSARDSDEIKSAKEEHMKAMREINDEARRQGFVTGTASSMNQAPIGGGGASGGGGGGFGGGIRGAFAGLRRGAMSMIAGMGGGALAGGLFSIIGNMFNEGAALEESSIVLQNLTGGTKGSPGLGLKTSEAQQYYSRFARQAGVGNLNMIADLMTTERKTGMDLGSLSPLLQFTRQGADIPDLTRRVLGMAEKSGLWGIDKGDFSALNEKMEHIGGLMEEQKQFQEDSITGSRAMGILGTFATLGGGFADDRALGRIQSISEGIRSPANDFVQAMMMTGIIRGAEGRGEGLDLFGVRQRMAQGTMGPNVFSDIMKEFRRGSGGNRRMMEMMIGTAFPSLMANQQALSMLSDPDFNADMFNEDSLQQFIQSGGEMNLGGRATSGVVMSNRAKIADVMATTGIKMIDALSGAMQVLIDGFEKIPKLIDSLMNIGGTIKDMFGFGDGTGIPDIGGGKVSWTGDYHSLFGDFSSRSFKGGAAIEFDAFKKGGDYGNLRITGATEDWINSLSQEEIKALYVAGTRGSDTGIANMSFGTAKSLIAGMRGQNVPVVGGEGTTTTDSAFVNALNLLRQAVENNTNALTGKSGGMNIKTGGTTGK